MDSHRESLGSNTIWLGCRQKCMMEIPGCITNIIFFSPSVQNPHTPGLLAARRSYVTLFR